MGAAMVRLSMPGLGRALLCGAFFRVIAVSSTTVSTSSEAPRAPTASYSGAEYYDSFENVDATSRGLLFPGLTFKVEEHELSSSDIASATVQTESGGQADRGFLTKAIGKYLDKFGNEIRMLCWTDDMCADNVDGRTSCSRGRCVFCSSSADCTESDRPVCDVATNTCVACISSSDCETGVCSLADKVCVECTTDARCQDRGTYIPFSCSQYGGNPRIELLRNTCGECFVNSNCPYRMICSEKNTCTCSTDAQCDSPQPYCFEGRCQACPGSSVIGDGLCSTMYTTGTCRLRERSSEVYECFECDSSADCGGAACVDGRCSCVANGCTDGLFCNTGSQKCVGCLEDAHCTDPSKPWCDSGKGQCVACTGVDGTCRKEMTVGTVACSTYGTCEPMCAEDADCLLESRPYCDLSSSRCAACREDSDCGPSAPFCLAAEEVTMDGTTRLTPARCVQCRSPSSTEDCHLGLTCNSQNFCAMCSSNNECPKDRPICSTDTRSCVQCDERAGLSCPKERPICHSGRCLGCESDADCGNVLLCDPNTNRCELCLTHQDCETIYGESRPYCSQTHQCHECRSNSDCSYQRPLDHQFPHCDQISGTCVQCSPILPCEAGGVCNEGRCVDCADSSQCSEALPICDVQSGRCIECKDPGDCPAGLGCFEGLCKECDSSTTAVCSSVIQKYHQSCSPQLTCESVVEFGSTASVLGVS